MVPVESGTFMMGSERGDEQASPVHQVTLSSYSIGLTEVTFGLWNAVMGSYPFDYSPAMDTDNSPVWFCSRDNAQEFIDALNALTGLDFHLPTEAQWEFAARGGNLSHGYLYAGSDELFEVGWIEMNEKGRIHEVGLLKPNELGLYDMSGNVREYCEDDYYNYSSVPQVDPSGLWTPYSPPMMVFRGAGEGSVSGGYTVTSRRDCWVARASHSQEIWGVGFRLAL
jgi:formylglycine-generating enzyme required for sulfatase activity